MEGKRLEGKCAVITGGGSGIGAAAAMTFAQHGAKIIIADINVEDAFEVAAEINELYPGSAEPVRADVSVIGDNKMIVAACIEKFGKIDIFYANAGVLNKQVPLFEETEEQFMKAISVNTMGAFMAIKYAGEAMVKSGRGGSIICTASIAGIRSDLTPLQYGASKAAILSMVKSANDRLLLDNVRVNAILPGGVMTPLMMSVSKNLDDQGLFLKGYDIHRFPPIDPSQIAAVALFLASDDSSPIKGQAIIADGGMSNSMGSQPYPQKKRKSSSNL